MRAPSTGHPNSNFSSRYSYCCVPLSFTSPCYQAVVARGPLVFLLSHWLAPQWAPPPSKRPLVSNCPPATVSGPAQPLVGVPVGPAHCRLVYKSPNSDLAGRWFFDTIVWHVVCWLSSCYSLFQQLISRFIDLWRCEQSELGLGNVIISFLLKK